MDTETLEYIIENDVVLIDPETFSIEILDSELLESLDSL